MRVRPFGEKAYTFGFRDPALDKPITILEGSIRSGKTMSYIPKIINGLCKYRVQGLRVIVGVSKQTVKDNLLRDLFETIGEANYRYNNSSGELILFGVPWLVIGAKDEGSEKYLLGKTIGIALVEEGRVIPESFFMQLIARLSPKGSRLYVTTNPDHPYHYLKEKIIDNPDIAGDVEVIHFDLDDNPNLPVERREFYNRMYKGVFHQRFILGLWVAAEGAIYKDALGPQCEYDDASRPVGLENTRAARYIGVDYGTINACVFLEIFDDGRTIWQDREYYWDSKAEYTQKTDEQYADDLDAFVGPNKRGLVIIIDPSAASFKVVLVRRGYQVRNGKNDVEEGIRKTASALTQGIYRIHKRNVHTNKELATYTWDEKAAVKGEEKPVKKRDHCPDTVRMLCHTLISNMRVGL